MQKSWKMRQWCPTHAVRFPVEKKRRQSMRLADGLLSDGMHDLLAVCCSLSDA